MLKYGIYTRKSDDDKSVTEKSITDQLAELEIIQQRNDLLVVKSWKESKSAKIPDKRPLYAEMISMIEAGEIDAILCWHINRLVRNMKEGGALVQLLIDGVIKEIRTPYGTYRSGDNILPLVIEAASATQFSLDHTKNVNRGMKSKTQRGGWNHRAPQGYLNVRHPYNPDIGQIAKDPERFDLIRKAWDMMLTGAYTRRQVQHSLNDVWGYRTRITMKQGGTPLSYAAVCKIFTNPFYAGFIQEEGQVLKGEHTDIAMVTLEEFQRVQEIIGRQLGQAPKNYEYPYTGLMICAYCGQQVTGETKLIKSNGQLWVNYHCSDSGNHCTAKGMSEDKVEAKIVEALESVTIDPELCEIAIENIVSELDRQAEPLQTVYSQQAKTLVDCENKLNELAQMWLRGLIRDESRYKALESEILETKNNLTIEVEKSQAELAKARANALAAGNYIKFARDRFMAATPSRKREIAHALGCKYLFYGIEKKIVIEVHPLLVEVVKFAKQVEASLELNPESEIQALHPTSEPVKDSRFSANKKAPLARSAFGGPCRTRTGDPRPARAML